MDRATLQNIETQLQQVNKELSKAIELAAKHQKLRDQRDMKASELEVLQVKLDSNEHYKVLFFVAGSYIFNFINEI